MIRVPATASYLSGAGEARFLSVVQIDVAPESTGLSMARALLAAHGLSIPDLELAYAGMAAGLPDVEDGWSALERALPAIVGVNGALNWHAYDSSVTFGDLQATADAGLCDRPERGVTIVLTGGSGGPGAVDWPHLLDLLKSAGQALIYLGGVYAGLHAIRDLLGAAEGVIDRAIGPIRRIAAGGSLPSADRVDQLLRNAPELQQESLSRGLELSPKETDDLLRLLGYGRPDGDTRYRADDDDVIKLASLVYMYAKWSEVDDDDDLVRARQELTHVIDRLSQRLAAGDPVPDEPETSWEPPT